MLHICIISQLCSVILTAREKKTTRKEGCERERQQSSLADLSKAQTHGGPEKMSVLSRTLSFSLSLTQTLLKDQHNWPSEYAVFEILVSSLGCGCTNLG